MYLLQTCGGVRITVIFSITLLFPIVVLFVMHICRFIDVNASLLCYSYAQQLLTVTLIIQFLYVAMSKEKEKVGSKRFRWLPPMHTTMLTLLAEEAMKGNKPLNTFKAGSFATVAHAISVKFGVECCPSFVENQLHTLRTMWSTIQTFQKNSRFGWDDNLKMITCDAKTYEEEVMVWLSTIFCYYSIVLMLLRCVLSYVSKY